MNCSSPRNSLGRLCLSSFKSALATIDLPEGWESSALQGPDGRDAALPVVEKNAGAVRRVLEGELGAIRGQLGVAINEIGLGQAQIACDGGEIGGGQEDMPRPPAAGSALLTDEVHGPLNDEDF